MILINLLENKYDILYFNKRSIVKDIRFKMLNMKIIFSSVIY